MQELGNRFQQAALPLTTNRPQLHDYQRTPPGDWTVWAIIAGRGAGKSFTGANFILDGIEGGARRVALVGRTSADVRDVMVHGPSGLIRQAESRGWPRPKHEPSLRRVTFGNGAVAFLYSAEEPDLLRGPEHERAWGDELAAWKYDEAWDNLLMTMRIGAHPQIVATTTPKPVKLVRTLMGQAMEPDAAVVMTRGRTRDNEHHLAPSFIRTIEARYAGTRIGRQELDGELLEDYEGALWTFDLIEKCRVATAPLTEAGKIDLARIVLAVDPATTHGPGSDETSFAVMGIDRSHQLYLLETWGSRATPAAWGRAVVEAADRWEVDVIVAEANQGGEMVREVITNAALELRRANPHRRLRMPAVQLLHARRAKSARAEAVSQAYEQGRVHHVGIGDHLAPEMRLTEDQMITFPVAAEHDDRVDALVHAANELMSLRGREARAA